MNDFATIDDVRTLWRNLSLEEEARCKALLPVVSASLRNEAKKVNKNLDDMITKNEELELVAKSVTVDVVARALMTSTDAEPTVQFSQAAGGYSISGTYLVPGGGLFIKKSELARLGLKRQRVGVIDLCPESKV